MATFSQWKSSSKISRVYWVHGVEPILVSEVVSDIRRLVNPGALDRYTIWGTEARISEISDLLRQQPLFDEVSRLILVKDADSLDSFDFLEEFFALRTELPRTHLVLESSSPDIPEKLIRFSRKLQVVKCSPPNHGDLVKLAQRWARISAESANALVSWSAGNVTETWHMSQKVRLLNLPSEKSLTSGIFKSIADSVPSTFAEALISVDKAESCRLAASVAVSDISGLCSFLELRLEQIEDILDYLRSGGSLRTFKGVPGVSYVVVESLASSVAHYDSGRIRRCRTLLALIDAESRSGATIGLLEALVALW